MVHISRMLCVAGCVASTLLGCSSSDTPEYTRPVGRGSAACQAWQKSFCDLVAVECDQTTEAKCVDTYYTLTCNSDEKAQSCATSIDNATCATGLPAGCNIADLIDPAPAVTACQTMLAAICAKSASCGQTTADQCLTTLQAQLDCSKAVGYTASYESCVSDISKMTCTASSEPSTCKDVIVIQ